MLPRPGMSGGAEVEDRRLPETQIRSLAAWAQDLGFRAWGLGFRV